jgi:hypothetical protein
MAVRKLNLPLAELRTTIGEVMHGIANKKGFNHISRVPIYVTYRSNSVPDLTIIDTPGYVSTATKGQSEDMPENIRQLLVERCWYDSSLCYALRLHHPTLTLSSLLFLLFLLYPHSCHFPKKRTLTLTLTLTLNLNLAGTPKTALLRIRLFPRRCACSTFYGTYSNTNAIVVAVASASGVDIEAQNFWAVLKHPKIMEIDPKRKRVLGVLTHMDCAQGKYGGIPGIKALDHVLSNQEISLGYGWIGLSCLNKSPGRDQESKEEEYLSDKASLKQFCGVEKLRVTLHKVLNQKITEQMPAIQAKLGEVGQRCNLDMALQPPRLHPRVIEAMLDAYIHEFSVRLGVVNEREKADDILIAHDYQPMFAKAFPNASMAQGSQIGNLLAWDCEKAFFINQGDETVQGTNEGENEGIDSLNTAFKALGYDSDEEIGIGVDDLHISLPTEASADGNDPAREAESQQKSLRKSKKLNLPSRTSLSWSGLSVQREFSMMETIGAVERAMLNMTSEVETKLRKHTSDEIQHYCRSLDRNNLNMGDAPVKKLVLDVLPNAYKVCMSLCFPLPFVLLFPSSLFSSAKLEE